MGIPVVSQVATNYKQSLIVWVLISFLVMLSGLFVATYVTYTNPNKTAPCSDEDLTAPFPPPLKIQICFDHPEGPNGEPRGSFRAAQGLYLITGAILAFMGIFRFLV